MDFAPQGIIVESLVSEQLPGRPETHMWLPLGVTSLFLHLTQTHFLLWDPTYLGSIWTVQLLCVGELSLAFTSKLLQSSRIGPAAVH